MSEIKVNRQKVQELMISKCWTIGDFAESAGVSRSTISILLNGHKVPRSATIGKICKALECEPSDILMRTDER